VWKFRIRALFAKLGVLKVVDQNISDEVDDSWKKAERCAKSTLIECLSDSFQNFATSDKARQIFRNFDAIHIHMNARVSRLS